MKTTFASISQMEAEVVFLSANDIGGLVHDDDGTGPEPLLASQAAVVEWAKVARYFGAQSQSESAPNCTLFASPTPRHSSGNECGTAGSCDDVLVGGEGDELRVCGTGQHLLIGSFGGDRLVAQADDGIRNDGITGGVALADARPNGCHWQKFDGVGCAVQRDWFVELAASANCKKFFQLAVDSKRSAGSWRR